ncbi:DUF2975 domain-containing protein [uncultured Caulobacter sp.]|uniref:DUF2975 domain-containing protein n=1 Tax=uncultured Caulobacter sp. TaxID=158749 RepID=UPI0026190045|nr:DUF2975 domain-containing protein [uncultured Caulobacter sp.]
MRQTEIDRFRRRCGQFRGLAIFMVVSVGALMALIYLVFPALFALTGRGPREDILPRAIWASPAICYLFGVWSIGQAMGEIGKGRLIQPALSAALRRVGLALVAGGVASVFLVSNLLRLVGSAKGGYLHFDVPGMALGMIGGALFLLGRVVDQANAAQAELDEMI